MLFTSKLRSFLIIVTFFCIIVLFNPLALDYKVNIVLAIASLMILLWIFEPIPIGASALIPIILIPLFNINTIKYATKSFASPIIFLFLGGFMLGLAMEKWNLHKRIALNIINLFGISGNKIILGFMASTAFISMWISNTATTAMMFPMVMSLTTITEGIDKKQVHKFYISILLGIAFAANIGGASTIIGTPPNLFLAGYLSENLQYQITFYQWFIFAFPISIILLIITYLLLIIIFRNYIYDNQELRDFFQKQHEALGPITKNEKSVLIVFSIVVLLWMLRSYISSFGLFKLHDAIIALAGAIALFVIPADKNGECILMWDDTKKISWDILLFFGGGITLGIVIKDSGILNIISVFISSYSDNPYLVLLFVIGFTLFITELLTNSAVVAFAIPLFSVLSNDMGMHPIVYTGLACFAASIACMLPMATPPNAIVFSSKKITIANMMQVGFIINIISILVLSTLGYATMQMAFGLKL